MQAGRIMLNEIYETFAVVALAALLAVFLAADDAWTNARSGRLSR